MKKILQLFSLLANYVIDINLYIFRSSLFFINNQEKIEGRIGILYHSIEKGLSMEDIRYKFGRAKITKLINWIRFYYTKGYDINRSQFKTACCVLTEYYDLHSTKGIDIGDYYSLKDYEFISKNKGKTGGTITITGDSYFNSCEGNFKDFSNSRKSIRYFTEQLITKEEILDVLNIAKNAPSVCNRQPYKVYFINNKEKVHKIIQVQKGINGSLEKIHQLLAVVVNRNYYTSVGERYQFYVDGGIFLQNLLYALHYNKIAACPMHWALNFRHEFQVRNIFPNLRDEKIIALVAIGKLDSSFSFNTPYSVRKNTSELLAVIN